MAKNKNISITFKQYISSQFNKKLITNTYTHKLINPNITRTNHQTWL